MLSVIINSLEACFKQLKEIMKVLKEIRDMVDEAPTIDAEPVRHGEWFDKGSLSCRCSECGCKNTRESAFCPNCGAKMDLT